jgi:hypothetical protein
MARNVVTAVDHTDFFVEALDSTPLTIATDTGQTVVGLSPGVIGHRVVHARRRFAKERAVAGMPPRGARGPAPATRESGHRRASALPRRRPTAEMDAHECNQTVSVFSTVFASQSAFPGSNSRKHIIGNL